MSIDWFRWHHGTVNDPKWRVIARRAKSSVHIVLAVWAAMLENASQAEPRGILQNWNHEDAAAGLDLDTEEVQAIYEAMQGKTLDGNHLTGWDKRQPKREREESSAERVRAFRERQKKANETRVTPCNAIDNQETPRSDKRREEISPDSGSVTLHSSGSARASEDGSGGASTEAGRMAKALRERGVNVTPSNPELRGWLAQGATVPLVLDAVTEARASKPEPEQIAAKYLTPIVTRMLAGPSTTGPPSIQAGDSNHGNRRGSGYATSRGTRKSSAADEARDAERRLEERLRRERGEDVARRGIQGDGQVVDAHDRDFRPPVEVAVR